MNSNNIKMRAIASGVALGLATMAAQAATPPTLPTAGAQSQTVFTGGATVNGGASYLTTVPAADAADLIVNIEPAPGNVGQTGSIVVIASIPGMGLFLKLSGGIWIPWTASDPVQPVVTKTLAANEEVKVLDGLVGSDTNLAGMTIQAYVGYYTGDNISNLTYTSTPASITIANAPAAGCPTNTTLVAGTTFAGKPVCQLSGAARITTNTHLTANNSYFINGTVFVGTNTATDNANKISLTIDAGTTLFAPEGVNTLVIDRGAKIFANGTPAKPVIMTSEVDVAGVDTLNTRGKWGGLVINGRAQLNTQSGFDEGEGSTGEYGGGTSPVNTDDSGAVTYVQIKYAGFPITTENELNSIALQGVGSGTILDYIQVHNGADDAIEFYGGTVNAKHLLLTGTDDDALDWTTGYIGKLQHILIKQTTSGDNCIEADNLGSNPIATPRSIPTISNLTCIGSSGVKSSGHAFELKAGTGMNLSNAVIGGTFPTGGEGCILIAGTQTFTNSGASIATLNGTLTMKDSLITTACAVDLKQSTGAPWTTSDWYGAQTNATTGTVDLGGPNGWANGSLINAIPANIPSDSFFDQVDYIGGVKDSTSDWTKGWTFTSF
ncbi:MAG: hypothetical protein O2971_11895 [Proteobacteria bacterium]|nr:hypothetical protein [Pseudomonadota bacterium]